MFFDVASFFILHSLSNQSALGDALIIFFAEYLPYLTMLLFIGFVVFSAYSQREKFSIVGVSAAATILSRFGVTEIIRFFYHRPRPFLTYHFQPLLAENEWSFPSGHATFFFALATIVYLYNKRWGILFFILGIIITVSRIIAGVHYPSDIIGGIVIGIASAYAVFFGANYFFIKRKIS